MTENEDKIVTRMYTEPAPGPSNPSLTIKLQEDEALRDHNTKIEQKRQRFNEQQQRMLLRKNNQNRRAGQIKKYKRTIYGSARRRDNRLRYLRSNKLRAVADASFEPELVTKKEEITDEQNAELRQLYGEPIPPLPAKNVVSSKASGATSKKGEQLIAGAQHAFSRKHKCKWVDPSGLLAELDEPDLELSQSETSDSETFDSDSESKPWTNI